MCACSQLAISPSSSYYALSVQLNFPVEKFYQHEWECEGFCDNSRKQTFSQVRDYSVKQVWESIILYSADILAICKQSIMYTTITLLIKFIFTFHFKIQTLRRFKVKTRNTLKLTHHHCGQSNCHQYHNHQTYHRHSQHCQRYHQGHYVITVVKVVNSQSLSVLLHSF